MMQNELIHVATFGHPQGLKGDIKLNIFTSSFDSFKILEKYYLENEENVLVFKKLKLVGKKIICSLFDCKDRDSALIFKGKHILSLRKNFPKTKNNEYYVVDLIDSQILDLKNNILGIVKDIKNFGAGDLIEMQVSNKNIFYIPMNNENLIDVDTKKKIMIVNPIKGILE